MKVNQFYKSALVFMGFFFASQASSQDYNFAVKGEYQMPGFGGARAYDDQGVDEVIDPFTGGLKLVVRDLHLPGNGGLDISVLRFYNNLQSPYNPQSASYDGFESPGTILTGRSVVGLGWDMHFGRVWTRLGNAIHANSNPAACKIANISSEWNPVLELPDGTRKLLVNDEGTSTSSSYSFTTADFWKAKCLPPSAESVAGRGGLLVTSPEGVTYTFNVRGLPVGVGNGVDTKNPYLVTKIEDRNGNTLNITYKNTWPTTGNVARHVLVDKITSSDGRSVSFTYSDETTLNATLKSVTAHGQYVGYSYGTGAGDTVNAYLTSVSRPDDSTVSYEYYNTTTDNTFIGKGALKKIRNPYGLSTEYTYGKVVFGLNGLDPTWVVTSKKTTGSGITTGNWTYSYAPSSTSDKTTVVSNDNCIIYEHVGNRALPLSTTSLNPNLWKAGILLSKEIRSKSSSSCGSTVYQREQYDWVPLLVSNHNDFRIRLGGGNAYALCEETYAPRLAKATITRNGTNYVTEYNQPDAYGNARQIIERHGNVSRTTNLTYKTTGSFNVWLPHVVVTKNMSGVAGDMVYGYDNKGNLTREDNYGLITTYTYTSRGDVASVTRAGDQVTSYSDYYRGVPRREDQPESVTYLRTVDARGNITCENISTYAQASSVNCENITTGVKTKYTYDEMNRLAAIVTPLTTDNNVSIAYSHAGGSYKSTVTRGPLTTTTQFHPYGGVRKKDVSANGTTYTINYEYNPLGQMKFESYPNSTQGDRFEYDQLGRIDKVTHTVDSSVVDYTYLADNKIRISDERNNSTTYEYRSFGHPDNKWLIKTIAPEGQTTEIVRLNSGLIDYVTQGGYTHDYGYNSYWQLISETRPETGTTTYGRDLAGNMTSRQVGASPVTYFYYDKLNRLKSVNYPDTTPDKSYSYSIKGELTGITHSNGIGNWVYDYDLNGNLSEERISIGADSYTLKYFYNANDALSSIQYPTLKSINYSPDGFGRPTQVSHYVSGITYHSNGQLSSFTYANGRKTNITQTARLLPKRFLVTNSSGSNVVDMDHGYDAAGNLTSMASSTHTQFNKTLTYDGLDRLIYEDGTQYDGQSTYDSLGNLLSKSYGPAGNTYTYDTARNRLSSLGGVNTYQFTYDYYGNVTKALTSFEYDHASNLTAEKWINSVTLNKKYQYDGNDRRAVSYDYTGARKKHYTYNKSGRLMHEKSFTGTGENTIYIYLGNQLVATEKPCSSCGSLPSVTYYTNDLIGSAIQASNETGAVVWDARYGSFGEKYGSSNITLGYTGHVYDADSQLTYMQGRYYHGWLGRFMGIDPVGFSENNPMSFNRYSYGNNNPYKYTDPDGRVIFLAPLLWTAGVVALATYSDYANTPVEAGDIHTKPAYEPILTVAGTPALKGMGALGDDAIRGAIAANATRKSVNSKLSGYLLNKSHPKGSSKAQWFDEALGFNMDNAKDLAKQIVFDSKTAIPTEFTEHGLKYNQVISITGANGRTIDVTFGWIRNNDGVMRLVTAIPTKR